MEESEIKLEYNFLEAGPAADVRELEAKLSAQLRDLFERNTQLNQRNTELRRAAEIGWNAEVQIKKFAMTEADMGEEIRNLRFEREMFAGQIKEKENVIAQLKASIDAQKTEIRHLQKQAQAFEFDYTEQIQELSRQIAKSRAEENRLAKEHADYTAKQEGALAEIQRRHEQTLGVAQETFHAQLSDLSKIAWNAGTEAQNLGEALNTARAETARLQAFINSQDENYRAQLTELAESSLESEREVQNTQKTQGELIAEIEKQRAGFEKTIAELRRALESERNAHAQSQKREAVVRAEADRATAQAKDAMNGALEADEGKRLAVAAALQGKSAELAKAIEAKTQAENNFEAQKSSVVHMSAELNNKIRELRESNETIQKQMNVIGEQSRAAEGKSAEMGGLRVKMEALQTQMNAQSDSIRAKEQEIDKLNRELRAKDEVVQRQLITLSNMTRVDKEKEIEIQRYRFAETSLSESVNELRRAGRERDELRKEFEAHIARLNTQLDDVRSAAQETQSSFGQETMSLNTQLQMVRSQLEASREAVQQARSERDAAREALQTERENAATIAEMQDNRAGQERAELERLSAQLQQREFQLRHYAANVSDEKGEVLRRAKQLADEIRAATTLTPLKDYLSLTEFELGKVEMQLRKTPVISIERPRLEASFNAMIEQRDFLKAAIANSQSQLDHQAAQLLKIARPEKLAPIPPMPPRKTSV